MSPGSRSIAVFGLVFVSHDHSRADKYPDGGLAMLGRWTPGTTLHPRRQSCNSPLVVNKFHSRLRSVQHGSHVGGFHFARNAYIENDVTPRFHRPASTAYAR
jgi:hypothetical protein